MLNERDRDELHNLISRLNTGPQLTRDQVFDLEVWWDETKVYRQERRKSDVERSMKARLTKLNKAQLQ